jgi:hypothetical protein
MGINRDQQKAIVLGAVIAAAACLYPPWTGVRAEREAPRISYDVRPYGGPLWDSATVQGYGPAVVRSIEYDAGYAWLFTPPDGGRVNLNRLAVQLGLILFVTAALAFFLHGGRWHLFHVKKDGTWALLTVDDGGAIAAAMGRSVDAIVPGLVIAFILMSVFAILGILLCARTR